jgi:hypothetical protein
MVFSNFPLPDSQLLRDHVEQHAPRAPRMGRGMVLAVLTGALIVLLLLPPSPLTSLLPWLMLGGLLFWLTQQRSQLVHAQRGVRHVMELTALRRPHDAVSVAWHLIPNLHRWPELHVQGVLLMGANLMSLRQWDAAIEAQSYLLDHLPPGHPTAHLLRAQRLMGLLREDRLADADSELRTLQRIDMDPLTAAIVKTASVMQQVKTHHDADALASVPQADAHPTFAPMGAEAGYAHGLLALAAHRTDQPDLAQQYWTDATMLQPADRLLHDMPELQPLVDLVPSPDLGVALAEDRHD